MRFARCRARPSKPRSMAAIRSSSCRPAAASRCAIRRLPLLKGDLTVVVSPLISLMKDQVDGLRACGVPAVQIDSTLSESQRRQYANDIRQHQVRLVFVSPERLAMGSFQSFLQQVGVARFAIDEAHCISHWGHDFRPEYRQLSLLKELFPQSVGPRLHGHGDRARAAGHRRATQAPRSGSTRRRFRSAQPDVSSRAARARLRQASARRARPAQE